MHKPTIYLDTSIFSANWYEGADVAMLARQMRTREWWDLERRHFVVWSSAFAQAELRAGKYPRQRECLKMIRRLRYLPATASVRSLSQELVDLNIVPTSKQGDADHLAISAIHGIDYLLTWNYAHMANANVQTRFEKLCDASGLVAPLMVSPESIPQVRFGMAIRRN